MDLVYHLRELLSFTRVVVIYESYYYLRELSIYGICCRFIRIIDILRGLSSFDGNYCHFTGFIVGMEGVGLILWIR